MMSISSSINAGHKCVHVVRPSLYAQLKTSKEICVQLPKAIQGKDNRVQDYEKNKTQ